MKIAILGFGRVGQQFATLFSRAGCEVRIGLHDPKSAADISQYQAGSFAEAIAPSEAVALAVPYAVVTDVLREHQTTLEGKIIIDNTNPLNDDWSPLLLGQENSAAEIIARLLPDAFVVKAFNTIFADVMHKSELGGHKLTAFIASDHAMAKQKVMALATNIGYQPLDVGPLFCARYLESMAHLNIHIALAMQGGTQAAFHYTQA